MLIERCTHAASTDWIALRRVLWPDATASEHDIETAAILDCAGDSIAFLARAGCRPAVGFAEATLRRDYVNGCTSSPVAFLEGIYVSPDWRKRGVARLLCRAVEKWAFRRGCSELASDTDLLNTASQLMHVALGFAETERVVFFRKSLTQEPTQIHRPANKRLRPRRGRTAYCRACRAPPFAWSRQLSRRQFATCNAAVWTRITSRRVNSGVARRRWQWATHRRQEAPRVPRERVRPGPAVHRGRRWQKRPPHPHAARTRRDSHVSVASGA